MHHGSLVGVQIFGKRGCLSTVHPVCHVALRIKEPNTRKRKVRLVVGNHRRDLHLVRNISRCPHLSAYLNTVYSEWSTGNTGGERWGFPHTLRVPCGYLKSKSAHIFPSITKVTQDIAASKAGELATGSHGLQYYQALVTQCMNRFAVGSRNQPRPGGRCAAL